jgi:hypothetical protein
MAIINCALSSASQQTTRAECGLHTMGGELVRGGGGPSDVAFIDGVAYVLVGWVNGCFGEPDRVGIHRMKGPGDFSLLADLGAGSAANEPATDYFLPCGGTYAVEPFRGGLPPDKSGRSGRENVFQDLCDMVNQ